MIPAEKIPAQELIDQLFKENLSTRLQRAVDAMRVIETRTDYRIEMAHYHSRTYPASKSENYVCLACAGGAAAIAFFNAWDNRVTSTDELLKQYQGDPLFCRLTTAVDNYERVIDWLRVGDFRNAFFSWIGEYPVWQLDRVIIHYYKNPVKFYEGLDQFIVDLKAHNL